MVDVKINKVYIGRPDNEVVCRPAATKIDEMDILSRLVNKEKKMKFEQMTPTKIDFEFPPVVNQSRNGVNLGRIRHQTTMKEYPISWVKTPMKNKKGATEPPSVFSTVSHSPKNPFKRK